MMRTVSSPASVPTMRSCSSWSSARAIAGAELGLQHDDIPGGRHLAAELTQDRIEDLGRIGPAGDVREHIPRPTEVVVRLLEPELTNVARDGRLRDDATGIRKRVEQLA